jgi:hypothetical protein
MGKYTCKVTCIERVSPHKKKIKKKKEKKKKKKKKIIYIFQPKIKNLRVEY